jgi:hypothetical protein
MLAATPSDWFSLRPGYAGQGIAIFSDPAGELRGSVSVNLTESGEPSVTMDVTEMEAPASYSELRTRTGRE